MGNTKTAPCRNCGKLLKNVNESRDFCKHPKDKCKNEFHSGVMTRETDERIIAHHHQRLIAKFISGLYKEMGDEVKDIDIERFLINLSEAIFFEKNERAEPVFVFYDFEIVHIEKGRYRIQKHGRELYDAVWSKAMKEMEAKKLSCAVNPEPVQVSVPEAVSMPKQQTWAQVAADLNFFDLFNLHRVSFSDRA